MFLFHLILTAWRKLFSPNLFKNIEKLLDNYGFNSRVPIIKLMEADDKDLKFLADYIYEKIIFKLYNEAVGQL